MACFKASDPRDTIYAPLGLTGSNDKPLAPDYNRTVQQVYIDAARHFIKEDQDLGLWGESSRHSKKDVLNLPTWVPDWSHNSDVSSMFTQITHKKDHLIKGKPTTTETALHVNGCILDRVIYVTPITIERDIYEIVKPTVQALADLGRGIFDVYPASRGVSENMSNLDALSDTLSWVSDIVKEGGIATDEAVAFLAWKISADGDTHSLSKKLPKKLRREVREWGIWSKESCDFDLGISERMEDDAQYDIDLVYTENGYFGLTNLREGEKGMVVAILGGAEEIGLLRENEGSGDKWYEYIDVIYMNHMKAHFGTLDDIQEGARVKRLEIR